MTAMNETSESDKCQKERERRRKKYKFALVRWEEVGGWEDAPTICIESKKVLRTWWQHSHKVLCDDQPEKVLRAMLKLMEEPKE
jgi:hypothetical protein